MDCGTAESKASSEMTDAPNKDDDRCNRESASKKRKCVLKEEDYFMAIAFLSAQRSEDPRTQVGACIVNEEKKIVGIGYNGMPNGCPDGSLPWAHKAENRLDTKYLYVCHAELNAILNKNSADVKKCTIYVALFPCNECAKVIIQSGIKEVIYYSDKYRDKPEFKASRRMFMEADVKHRQYRPTKEKIEIDFTVIDLSLSPHPSSSNSVPDPTQNQP